MRNALQSRATKRTGIICLLTMVVLALMPMAPAAAVQTISWTTSPPATAVVGQQVAFAWSGTANTFLGARITGCFATYPNGNNFSYAFGGNFTTDNCNTTKTLTAPGNYSITVGFTLSTGGQMSQSWNVNVAAPTPTVAVPSSISTSATSVEGAAVQFTASASDSYYGASNTTCSPASGSVFPVGTTTVSCSATNPGNKTGVASFAVTVGKSSPTLLWSPPTSVLFGTTYAEVMTAEMQAADAAGTITYEGADGTAIPDDAVIPIGPDHVVKATYVPSRAAASAYHPVTAERTINVDKAASAVAFDLGSPTTATFGDAPFTVDVSGTPGAGDVTVRAQTGSTCTVDSPSAGTAITATVTLTRAGDCVLLADQAATDEYTAAPTAQWSVTTSKGNPEITWTPPSTLTYGDAVSDLFGATADVPGTMTYLVDGAEIEPDAVIDAGAERSVSVTFTPDQSDDYTDATATRTFTVEQAAQRLSVAEIADKTFGGGPFSLDINGTGPGAISTSATGLCTVDDAKVTIVGAGECSVTVAMAGTNNYLSADPVTRTFTITPAAQTLTVGQIANRTYGDEPFSLDIGETGPGTVSASAAGACTVTELTVTIDGAGECAVTVEKSATSDYLAPPSVTRTFTVDPAAQTLTVGQIADRTFGDGPFTLDIGGTGPGTVTASAVGPCTFDGLTVTLQRAGNCAVTATSNYLASPPVTRTFTIKPAAVIAVPNISKISPNSGPTQGKKPVTITGSGFSGATSVKFGTVTARFTVKNNTTIVATSPVLKQGAYAIRVTTANGTSAATAASLFTVRPVPKITKLSATSGRSAGKKSLTIRGSGFTGATSVEFGKVAAKFKVKNSTTIVVTTPRLKKGRHDVLVSTSGGTSAKAKAARYKVKK